ncbi:MAG: alpha/beta hydrolase fold domain-containing protein [Gammaproteobacteria bacterium]|nr:alpha/beta hydrolase fold domain-containing protein [Gammaproteobacteria bacterium]
MKPDTQTQALLDQMNTEGNPKLFELTVEQARSGLKEMTLAVDAPEMPVLKIRDEQIAGPVGEIPLRIYWPEEAKQNSNLPILLLYHGGGFALGDLDTHNNMSRFYCASASVIVVSVDYRLAPEHKFPVGVEDCYAALCWAAENAASLGADPKRLAVTGDSAGGNLSAVMCQLTQSRGGPAIAFQVLVYPGIDMSLEADYPSRDEYGPGGFFLSNQDMDWLRGMYYSDVEQESKDTRSSPVYAEDLSGQPAALIITAGFDPLRDEGKHYADKLREAGVTVEYLCFESTIHGFFSFSGALDVGRDGLQVVAERLRDHLHA